MEEKFKKFQELKDQWIKDTQHLSSHKADNQAHQAIVSMGTEAIPFIMADWKSNPKTIRHWFHALYEISGHVNPVPQIYRGKVPMMQKCWYKWCIDSGYKPYEPSAL